MTTLRAIDIVDYLPAAPVYGILATQPPIKLPSKRPASDYDYAVSLTRWCADASDTLARVTMSAVWASSGDAEITNVTASGVNVVVFGVKGGKPGRTYPINALFETVGGRAMTRTLFLPIEPTDYDLGAPVEAPGSTVADTIIWTSGASVSTGQYVSFDRYRDALIATGTNKATALKLSSQTNVIASIPAGTAVELPLIISGVVRIVNTTASDCPVYAPGTAQIDDGAPGAAATLSAFSHVDYETGSGSTRWIST